MGNLRIRIFTIQDQNIQFLITSIMNILNKQLTWQRWRRIISLSQNWPFPSFFKHGIFSFWVFLLMTFAVIPWRITGPYIISVFLGKWDNQVPKQGVVKYSQNYFCATNQNSVGLKQELGFQGDSQEQGCRLHSWHCPLTWWSSLFHLCLPSSPIHKVSPGSSSRSLKGEASLKTCSCGCNFGRGRGGREEKKKKVICQLYLFFQLTYFTSHTQHPNTFTAVKYTAKTQARKNRLAGLLMFVIVFQSVERYTVISNHLWVQAFGRCICHTPSVLHPQYSFSTVFNTRDGEHFHSLPSPVQMPALRTAFAKKSNKPNQTRRTARLQTTRVVRYLAREGTSTPILAASKPFFVSCVGTKEGCKTSAYGCWIDSICRCCCTWLLSIKLFLQITFKRLQYLRAHTVPYRCSSTLCWYSRCWARAKSCQLK